MADVLAVFTEEAAAPVNDHATTTQSRPAEVLSLVRDALNAQALQQPLGGSLDVPPPEVLLDFLRGVLSTCDRAADRRGGAQTRTEASGRVLRDLREYVAAECAPLRREPEEQSGGESADALRLLSRFLARCCAACWSHARGADASDISMNISRVGTLRGAGNAIVPQVAAEVIGAYMDYRNIPRSWRSK